MYEHFYTLIMIYHKLSSSEKNAQKRKMKIRNIWNVLVILLIARKMDQFTFSWEDHEGLSSPYSFRYWFKWSHSWWIKWGNKTASICYDTSAKCSPKLTSTLFLEAWLEYTCSYIGPNNWALMEHLYKLVACSGPKIPPKKDGLCLFVFQWVHKHDHGHIRMEKLVLKCTFPPPQNTHTHKTLRGKIYI